VGGAQIRVERFKYRNLNQVVCTLPPAINGARLCQATPEKILKGLELRGLKAR